MAVVYHVQNLTKSYKKTTTYANDQLSLDIQEGEIFGLLGPNGSGKSTLVKQLVGLIQPSSGQIRLYGIDVVKSPEIIPDYVALQPQSVSALVNMYPEEALLGTARLRGASWPTAHKQVKQIIEKLELSSFCAKALHRLSGGQLQLVNVALALVGDRPVQIFDEPTNNLAPEIRKRVWETLLEQNRQGTTIILVTHDVAEAELIIQRVGILNHGQLLALGSVGDLKASINKRVRIELQLKPQTVIYTEKLAAIVELKTFTSQHLHILCASDQLQNTINYIITEIGLNQLEDFRVLTPSLEDVYLQLGGSNKIAS